MKIKKLIVLFLIFSFVLTACEENKRKAQEERQRRELKEAEREAEIQEDEKRKKMEANSIAARAMEEQTLGEFMAALQNTDLAKTFTEEEGPFTIFAPTDEAFDKIEKDSLDALYKEDNEDELISVLEYHVVEDEITYEDLSDRINEGDGEYTIMTMSGTEFTALMSGEDIILKDAGGNTASLGNQGIVASNGVLYLIDRVLTEEEN